MSRELPVGTEDRAARSWIFYCRLLMSVLVAVLVLQPAFHLLRGPLTGTAWFQLIGALAMAGLGCWRIAVTDQHAGLAAWLAAVAILALGIALFAVGGTSWLANLAIAAALCGRFSRTPGPGLIGIGACTLAGLVVATVHHNSPGELFSSIVIAPLAGLFAYSAARRADDMNALRRTRAELARAAVAEERLRIARDLHDLLGHSLSLITLKAELAGRLMGRDPSRAAREIAELESVARQSLSDVREAVAGFHQPDLAAELVAARQLFDAAGIVSRISAPPAPELGSDVDAALAWGVREGAMNVVRHSRATQAAITVTAGPDVAVAEISDNGPAAESLVPVTAARPELTVVPADGSQVNGRAPVPSGSGLAGLAERVRQLGGELAAGAVQPHGLLLRVVVPDRQGAS